MEKAIAWFEARKGKVTYSMENRRGTKSYDCSSAVYLALIEAGIFPSTIGIGNTDSEFKALEVHGFTIVPADKNGVVATKRGDVFIWGIRGQSSGAFGHTGIFVNENDIIHCNFGYNGITVNNHDLIASYNGWPNLTVYRYTGNAPVSAAQATDQIVEVGSFIRFDKAYTANGVELVGNTWQVRTNDLCKSDFTWEDNGIPAAALTEVDDEGYATADQELAIGSKYKIPGKFLVLDVGESNGTWMAQVGAGTMTFWVDIETATEVSGNDGGTPVPSQRQAPVVVTPPTPVTPVPPVIQEKPPVSESPVTDTPKSDYTEADRARDNETNSIAKLILAIVKAIQDAWNNTFKK
jgi:hypothetical protein